MTMWLVSWFVGPAISRTVRRYAGDELTQMQKEKIQCILKELKPNLLAAMGVGKGPPAERLFSLLDNISRLAGVIHGPELAQKRCIPERLWLDDIPLFFQSVKTLTPLFRQRMKAEKEYRESRLTEDREKYIEADRSLNRAFKPAMQHLQDIAKTLIPCLVQTALAPVREEGFFHELMDYDKEALIQELEAIAGARCRQDFLSAVRSSKILAHSIVYAWNKHLPPHADKAYRLCSKRDPALIQALLQSQDKDSWAKACQVFLAHQIPAIRTFLKRQIPRAYHPDIQEVKSIEISLKAILEAPLPRIGRFDLPYLKLKKGLRLLGLEDKNGEERTVAPLLKAPHLKGTYTSHARILYHLEDLKSVRYPKKDLPKGATLFSDSLPSNLREDRATHFLTLGYMDTKPICIDVHTLVMIRVFLDEKQEHHWRVLMDNSLRASALKELPELNEEDKKGLFRAKERLSCFLEGVQVQNILDELEGQSQRFDSLAEGCKCLDPQVLSKPVKLFAETPVVIVDKEDNTFLQTKYLAILRLSLNRMGYLPKHFSGIKAEFNTFLYRKKNIEKTDSELIKRLHTLQSLDHLLEKLGRVSFDQLKKPYLSLDRSLSSCPEILHMPGSGDVKVVILGQVKGTALFVQRQVLFHALVAGLDKRPGYKELLELLAGSCTLSALQQVGELKESLLRILLKTSCDPSVDEKPLPLDKKTKKALLETIKAVKKPLLRLINGKLKHPYKLKPLELQALDRSINYLVCGDVDNFRGSGAILTAGPLMDRAVVNPILTTWNIKNIFSRYGPLFLKFLQGKVMRGADHSMVREAVSDFAKVRGLSSRTETYAGMRRFCKEVYSKATSKQQYFATAWTDYLLAFLEGPEKKPLFLEQLSQPFCLDALFIQDTLPVFGKDRVLHLGASHGRELYFTRKVLSELMRTAWVHVFMTTDNRLTERFGEYSLVDILVALESEITGIADAYAALIQMHEVPVTKPPIARRVTLELLSRFFGPSLETLPLPALTRELLKDIIVGGTLFEGFRDKTSRFIGGGYQKMLENTPYPLGTKFLQTWENRMLDQDMLCTKLVEILEPMINTPAFDAYDPFTEMMKSLYSHIFSKSHPFTKEKVRKLEKIVSMLTGTCLHRMRPSLCKILQYSGFIKIINRRLAQMLESGLGKLAKRGIQGQRNKTALPFVHWILFPRKKEPGEISPKERLAQLLARIVLKGSFICTARTPLELSFGFVAWSAKEVVILLAARVPRMTCYVINYGIAYGISRVPKLGKQWKKDYEARVSCKVDGFWRSIQRRIADLGKARTFAKVLDEARYFISVMLDPRILENAARTLLPAFVGEWSVEANGSNVREFANLQLR